MSAEIIDGKAVAARVRAEVAAEVATLPITPGLATVLVGDDPASALYVRMKREDSAEVGIESFHSQLGADTSPDELASLLRGLNADERVHGILLQLPLPDHLDQDEFIALISPAKDVDGLTPANAGLLMQDRQEAMVKSIPLRRLATPEDLASLVVWLGSAANTYVSGETITLGGGAQS